MSQKDQRSWVRWVQGLGSWWILALARPFCRGTLETQDLKIVICRKTLETQDLDILICSETQKTQDLKILIVARPWKPRTLKFGYVANPRKPRTSKFWCLETLKSLDPTPFNTEFHAEHCKGTQKVMSSDDRTPKTWIVKSNATYRTHPAGGRL